MELLQTKYDPPIEAGDLIERPRLEYRLGEAGRVPLTIVQAPTGYGKTTLMSQWFHVLRSAGHPTYWLSIARTDGDGVGLMTYLAAALATTDKTNPHSESAFVFLDDVHLLDTEPLTALCDFIDRSPKTVHFVVASRVIPAIHLARLRARGKLQEVLVEDLRFSAEETLRFLAATGDGDLAGAEVAALEARTEGWIAGVKLARLVHSRCSAPKDKGSAQRASAFSGSHRSVADFFTEEVMAQQPEEIVEFLIKSSVVDRICPALCNALMGNDHGRLLLNRVEESGLFLLRLDDERRWYRYHGLFGEFLRRRLMDDDSGKASELLLRASRWMSTNGFPVEAINYALKGGDLEHAADLMEANCENLTYVGELRTVVQFAAQIPESILHRRPRLLLSVAWMRARNLRYEETRKMLGVVAMRIGELESAGMVPEEAKSLRDLLLHREMMLAAAHDDAPRVEQQCLKLLEDTREECHPYIAGSIYAQMAYAQREQYMLGDLDRLTSAAQGILSRSTYTYASVALHASLGPTLFFAGRTDAAVRALELGLEEAVRFDGDRSALAALPSLPLSEVMYESNDLVRAAELIEHTLPRAAELCFADQLMSGYLTQARLLHARADLGGALSALDEGMGIAVERGLERLRMAVVAERVHFMLQDGQVAEASRFAKAAGIPRDMEDLLPNAGVTTVAEMRATAWFRLAMTQSRMQEAVSLGKHWRRYCSARGAIRSAVRWDLLLAQALFLRGDHRAAERALARAINHASTRRLVRSFVDEGPVVRAILGNMYGGATEVLHPSDAFAAELLKISDQPGKKRAEPQLVAQSPTYEVSFGKFNAKEREVLGLVGSGMRNREVAQKLGMTEGSVKWYMQQVYDKIGTRRRFQAVERARQFGLIA